MESIKKIGFLAIPAIVLAVIIWGITSRPAQAEETEPVQEAIVEEEDDERWHIPATTYAALEELPRISYEVPKAENGAKRFMDYRTITDKTTSQWAIQQDAVTDEYGFRRYGDAYCVAMGTYYAETCGDVFEITLDSGLTFSALVSDIKRDCDTDETNRHREGNVVEFIVDKDAIPEDAAAMGDMSYGTPMQGKVVSIYRV
jgi:hypothetical protein